ncbi:MAG: D-2-hydroxyacid dehydrogenase [Bacteroidales bacterium]|nr:D-2-hydroxyacid dehydrogenase [Bacteroidales bacterium]
MKRARIVFLDADTVGFTNNLNHLKALGNVTFYPLTSADERISHIGDAEIIITNKVVIDAAVMNVCKELKLICVAATGMNNIDLAYAEKRGIQVKNVAGYSTESVVQVTIALLFYLLNKIRYYDDYTKSGNYFTSPVFTHFKRNFCELSGKRFGIIGLGAIGKRIAGVATAFGAAVVYHSTTGKNLQNPYPHLTLHHLLSTSDVVSVHCPLTPETRNLIGYEQIRHMKSAALLLNTGRGGIINEAGLARALDEGMLAGAGLDVMETEPPRPDNPLFHLRHPERIVITPHLAWASDESRERLIDGIIYNIKEYLDEAGRRI